MPFATSIASLQSRARMQATTGPKISSWAITAFRSISANSAGWMKKPLPATFAPPARHFPSFAPISM